MKLSQKQRILTYMGREPERWFKYSDFQREPYFIGYKAPTRIDELKKDYPRMFETAFEGRFIKQRLNVSCMSEWLHELPKELRYALHRTGVTKNYKPDAELELTKKGYTVKPWGE